MLKNPAEYVRILKSRIRERGSTAPGKLEVSAFLGAGLVLAMLLGLFLYAMASAPDVEQLDRSSFARATVVYTAGGEELTRYYRENRSWVSLDSIAPVVTEALIATEDRRFYDHSGIDIVRTAGAVFETIGGDRQGGSTITMQLARNAFAEVSDDFVLQRKMNEWMTSLQIERMYSKEEILEMYLNTIPFNYNAFGIEAAAHTYFDKTAADLNTLEAATLVGMLKGTTLYNPVQNPESSRERRNVVLQQMVDAGALDESEYEQLRTQETPIDFSPMTPTNNLAPYFAEYVREWLDDWAETNGYNLYTGGLRVYTTLDADMQREAEEAVREQLETLQAVVDVTWSSANPPVVRASAGALENARSGVDPFSYYWQTHSDIVDDLIRGSSRYRALSNQGVGESEAVSRLSEDAAFVDSLKNIYSTLQAGLVSINPANGHVKSWVGGRDFERYRFDHVADARRQPGSTFKPFVYAAALERGFSPLDSLRDTRIEYVDQNTGRTWSPGNFGSESERMMTVRDGLTYSKNTITSRLMMEVGPSAVADMARRMGIRSDLQEVPSLALGTSEVTLLELVSAYATIANQGIYHEPQVITRIETAEGRVLATFDSEGRQVVEPELAYGVLDMMRGVVDEGTGVRIQTVYGARGDVAGKTGTTQEGADGWFLLMHPELVSGSWVGFPSPLITFRTRYWGQGSHNALRIVGDYFQDLELEAGSRFHPPAGYTPPEERQRRRVADTSRSEQPDFDFAFGDDADDAQPADTGIGEIDVDTSDLAATEPDMNEPTDTSTQSVNDTSFTDAGDEPEAPQTDGAQGDTESAPQDEATADEEEYAADSEVERLNRQEREESQVDEYLERLEEQNGEEEDGSDQ